MIEIEIKGTPAQVKINYHDAWKQLTRLQRRDYLLEIITTLTKENRDGTNTSSI